MTRLNNILNNEQLESLKRDSEVLIEIEREIKNLHCHGFFLGTLWFSDNKENHPLDLVNGYKLGIHIEAPFILNEKCFIAEDFWISKYCTSSKSCLVYTEVRGCLKHDASQMTYKQSRYKYKVKNINIVKDDSYYFKIEMESV